MCVQTNKMAAHMKVTHTLYEDSTITLALFADIESCKILRQNVMSGLIEASLLKANMVIDSFQVLVAANKAVHLHRTNSMVTKNVHSEILYSLSPSKNISESFRSFGVSDSDKSVFVAIVDDADDKTLNKITELLGKEPSQLDQLPEIADTKLITKVYKVTEEELSNFSLLDSLVTRISSKEIITAGKGKN
ncbi:EKC/KEOPS complex subunit TPRKB-like [Physella acuta]|uniref:EKC/KEOPS complex subunit TPRKB-like n=1 Tax=Physella acuta TaxID=109671 RepID=UPI0027DBB937|nr:EKC/KEOPS complex subunit TPRKB-like [Physella acuta]